MAMDQDTHRMLERVLRLIGGKYVSSEPSVYLHGSRRDGSNQASSDLDITVVLRDPSWQVNVGNDLRNLGLDLPVTLDATVHSLSALNDPSNGYDAGRVIHAGDLVGGAEIRQELSRDAIAIGYHARVVEQARKGIVLLRGVDTMPDYLTFPNATLPFFGYEMVRKPSWYEDGVLEGTKELVATATWCASCWLSFRSEQVPYSKHEAVTQYAAARPGGEGDLVRGIWHLCRERLDYRVPQVESDRRMLKEYCRNFLDLEQEIATLCRTD
jgi:hypothetical protein